jgi:hypothetical protein
MKPQTPPKPTRWAALLLLLNAFPWPQELRAQAPDASDERVVYHAAFYAPFAPRTALDMVKQTPGFVLAADQELRRGFSGAVGNVLIDGERLTAKSQTLSDVLQRVPAGEVLRIELLRGGAVAGDASGGSVLANVVRTPSTGGGAWGLGFEAAGREPAPNGFFAWGGRRGVTEYSLGGNSYALQRELPGERSVYDPAGTLTARRRDESPREFAEYALNGQAARPLGVGRLSLTGQVSYSRYADESTLLTTTPSGIQLEDEAFPFSESRRIGEAGVSYQRTLGGWDLDVNALLTRTRYLNHVSATHFDAQDVQDALIVRDLEQDSGESILRATLARDTGRGRLEAGAELAVNTLEGVSRLIGDFGGGPFEISVPNDNLTVKENRAEAFVSQGIRLDRWSVELRLAAEVSELRFSGDTEQSVSLSYLKPRVQLTRGFGAHQLQLRLFRDVGQLDFTDFVSSVELSDDVINGGNPDLKPQTAWAAELIGDFRFTNTALRMRLFRHWLDDVADLVPVSNGTGRIDAPGNIGRGSLLGTEVALRLPLTKVLPGGALKVSGTFQDAQVHDPLTGARRGISDFVERQLKAELRQDLRGSKFSWGVDYTSESAATIYRVDEVDRKTKSSSLDLFVEAGLGQGLKLRLSMISALGDPETRERRFYSPDRNGALTEREIGRSPPGHWWLVSLSGGF